jgi:hypothetical protein
MADFTHCAVFKLHDTKLHKVISELKMTKLSQNPRLEKSRVTWGGPEATASGFRRNKKSQLPAPVLCQARSLSG